MIYARQFFRHWQNWLSLALVLLFVFIAVAAPYLSPDNPKEPGPFMRVGRPTEARPMPPDENAILGMLPRGVDVYHALVWGTRDALRFGLIVTLFSALFGILYGAASGYLEGRLGGWMLRIADAFLAFPVIAGLVFLQQLYVTTITAMGGLYYQGAVFTLEGEPIASTFIQRLVESTNPLMLSLIVFSWMAYARLVHSMVITLKRTDFIQAARALGGNSAWIIRKHLLHNSIGPALVLTARDVGGIVLLQATLTFIGLGGESIWGTMLANGRNWVLGPGGNILTYWWVFLPPTLAVMLFGIAWNMFGDSLNDMFLPTSYGNYPGRSFWSGKRKSKSVESKMQGIAPHVTRQAAPLAGDQMPGPLGKEVISRANDPILLTARQEARQGNLPMALHAYNHMIHHGRPVNDILPDLAQLARKYSQDPQVWQTLGDALVRAGDLNHAAQSYHHACKLQE